MVYYNIRRWQEERENVKMKTISFKAHNYTIEEAKIEADRIEYESMRAYKVGYKDIGREGLKATKCLRNMILKAEYGF